MLLRSWGLWDTCTDASQLRSSMWRRRGPPETVSQRRRITYFPPFHKGGRGDFDSPVPHKPLKSPSISLYKGGSRIGSVSFSEAFLKCDAAAPHARPPAGTILEFVVEPDPYHVLRRVQVGSV